jgi:hypothetical protein
MGAMTEAESDASFKPESETCADGNELDSSARPVGSSQIKLRRFMRDST